MALIKRKYNQKILFFILQAIVMFFLFLLLVDKQTIYLIKDIIEELNISSDVQTILVRMFISFRMTFNMPSVVGLIILVLQVLCAKWVIQNNFLMIHLGNEIVENEVSCKDLEVVEHLQSNKQCYLINLRLRN